MFGTVGYMSKFASTNSALLRKLLGTNFIRRFNKPGLGNVDSRAFVAHKKELSLVSPSRFLGTEGPVVHANKLVSINPDAKQYATIAKGTDAVVDFERSSKHKLFILGGGSGAYGHVHRNVSSKACKVPCVYGDLKSNFGIEARTDPKLLELSKKIPEDRLADMYGRALGRAGFSRVQPRELTQAESKYIKAKLKGVELKQGYQG